MGGVDPTCLPSTMVHMQTRSPHSHSVSLESIEACVSVSACVPVLVGGVHDATSRSQAVGTRTPNSAYDDGAGGHIDEISEWIESGRGDEGDKAGGDRHDDPEEDTSTGVWGLRRVLMRLTRLLKGVVSVSVVVRVVFLATMDFNLGRGAMMARG